MTTILSLTCIIVQQKMHHACNKKKGVENVEIGVVEYNYSGFLQKKRAGGWPTPVIFCSKCCTFFNIGAFLASKYLLHGHTQHLSFSSKGRLKRKKKKRSKNYTRPLHRGLLICRSFAYLHSNLLLISTKDYRKIYRMGQKWLFLWQYATKCIIVHQNAPLLHQLFTFRQELDWFLLRHLWYQ